MPCPARLTCGASEHRNDGHHRLNVIKKQLDDLGGANVVGRLLRQRGLASFDGYFYINLANRRDRRTHIESLLKKYGVPEALVRRVDAVRQPHNGHLGCVQSHIKALAMAKAAGLANVMIFEDDFDFTVPKSEVVSHALNHNGVLRTICDCAHGLLEGAILGILGDPRGGVARRILAATTSACYAINGPFYDRLLENYQDAEAKLKEDMEKYGEIQCTPYALDRHWKPLQATSKWYGIIPMIGQQKTTQSSIMHNEWRVHPSCQRKIDGVYPADAPYHLWHDDDS